ncbi:MAG: signal peptidase I [Terrimicrobiaceae bacterium]
MFFLTPRYIKDAKHYRHALGRIINYRRDVLKAKDLSELEGLQARLKEAIRGRDRQGLETVREEIDRAVGRIAPPPNDAGWRENVEVFLVAIVIAAGVRAYILQPFRIPTGSMQPTLYGVVGNRTDTPPPNFVKRAFEFVWLGRTYLNLVADEDIEIVTLRERTHLNFFTFTDIFTANKRYTVFSPADPLARAFDLAPGKVFKKGDPIAVGTMDTGDQVFVDKVSYHFLPPSRGDVFVFKTTGIRRIEAGLPRGVQSQHYIKRLVGEPGDVLRIDAPNLIIDGKEPAERSILRVISSENGYRGYANIPGFPFLNNPEDTFEVPKKSFFALGDNSYHSSDSRYWGAVPEANVSGRGLIVYWPFSKRWGLIR